MPHKIVCHLCWDKQLPTEMRKRLSRLAKLSVNVMSGFIKLWSSARTVHRERNFHMREVLSRQDNRWGSFKNRRPILILKCWQTDEAEEKVARGGGRLAFLVSIKHYTSYEIYNKNSGKTKLVWFLESVSATDWLHEQSSHMSSQWLLLPCLKNIRRLCGTFTTRRKAFPTPCWYQ